MAALHVALKPPNIPFSSVEEFQQKYNISVDNGIISIAEKVTCVLVAALQTKKEDQRCWDASNPSHVYHGIYYFVLSSNRYTSKYVYSFDPSKKSIQCRIGPLLNPHFFKNLVVEFGTGFIRQGHHEIFYDGGGIIMIYDLTHAQGAKEVRKHILNADSKSGWKGNLDKESQKIYASDLETGGKREFSLSDLLK